MKLNSYNFLLGLAFASAVIAPATQAEIVIHGTRVIYPSDAREVTLQVSNNGSKPALVQAWIDEGDPKSTPDQSKVPFMIAPPISRVEATKSQTLRITALPNASQLNQKQETVLWLNILDIPPRPTSKSEDTTPDNFLQLAIRSRIKFFYRPSSIKEDANLASDKLQWIKSGQNLTVKNPTPFHITMTSVYQKAGDKKVDLLPQGLMIKPFSEASVQLKNGNLQDMSFINVNDYGGRVEHPIKLQ
ncbi:MULTISPECIES: molecular chaperone [Acinetobacter]|uniref:Fimbria/pilus periplasmic chaperone n=2 Tax=Acinetobacter TaxID=469 RepID=A0A1E2YPU8_ACIPI|nr:MULTISPECIES: fimbria/pilus periplasmic chaperone [Acinetobacter]EXS33960.1 gram-negative pili assembly chaperone, C-terminal domain protein [Acinetobacter sp. 826659]KRJ15139.1 pilus assembly protein [Acinetobacter pittii]MBN6515398.1 fimbria/pilus periplasmic chaperone [Acinetobacter pittii]MBN6522681.1 fimbria/pilus periplasmic chaperone [Acinetobacter pittii]MBN6531552.1 fimbria/pilus periplasmic chaperone [Acinetobacter pittii]